MSYACWTPVEIARGLLGADFQASVPLMEGGLDSLAAIELRSAAAAAFSVALPPTLAFDYPTIAEMAAFIATKLPKGQQGPAPVRLGLRCSSPPSFCAMPIWQVIEASRSNFEIILPDEDPILVLPFCDGLPQSLQFPLVNNVYNISD